MEVLKATISVRKSSTSYTCAPIVLVVQAEHVGAGTDHHDVHAVLAQLRDARPRHEVAVRPYSPRGVRP